MHVLHPSSFIIHPFPMTLPPFKLERYFAKYEFNTEFLLCSSDCEAMSIADLLAFEAWCGGEIPIHLAGIHRIAGKPCFAKRDLQSLHLHAA